MYWNGDPIALELGPLSVRWYGLLFASGFYVGYLVIQRMFRAEKVPLALLDKLLIYMVVGTVIGARLGHTLFYEPDIYLFEPWRILKVWEGGLASHGAAMGVLVSAYLFTRKYGLPYFWVMDRIAVGALIASAFIRTGNFFNSEILGKPADVPWSVVFARVDQIPRHPAQLYEALAYLVFFLVLHTAYWKTSLKRKPGFFLGAMFALTFIFRFLVEFVKVQQVAFEADLPLNMGQLLSIPVVIGAMVLMVRALRSEEAPVPVVDFPQEEHSGRKKKKKRR